MKAVMFRHGLILLLLSVLVSDPAQGSTPQFKSCGDYKLNNFAAVGKKPFSKGSYEVLSSGIACSKLLGRTGILNSLFQGNNPIVESKSWQIRTINKKEIRFIYLKNKSVVFQMTKTEASKKYTDQLTSSESSASNSHRTPTSSLPEYWPLEKVADEKLVLIADQSVRKYISDFRETPKINLMVGPTTNKEKAAAYIEGLERAAAGWSKDWLPAEVDVALADVDDYLWMKSLWPEYGLKGGGFDDSKSGWEQFGRQCNQGGANFNLRPFFWGCLAENSSSSIGLKKFGPHEYTHLAQFGIIYHQSGKKFWNLPRLFSEGSADFYGVTFASAPAEVYSNWYSYWSGGFISSEARIFLKTSSTSEIERVLIDAMKDGSQAENHWYWTGAYATARLVAAKGHEGFLQYMRKFGETGDAFQAFESIYGLTFEKFAQIIAPEIKKLTRDLRS